MFSTTENTLFLTFDDGPFPEITPLVLNILKEYNAKATFFCQGIQAQQHPYLINLIISHGHLIGNHGYKHLSGFSTSHKKYCENAHLGYEFTKSKIFRPPYGRIWPWQYFTLNKVYKIVFWDVMAFDFSNKYNPERCFNRIIKKARNASVIVMHDSPKAQQNVLHVLPMLLKYYCNKGFQFKLLPLV